MHIILSKAQIGDSAVIAEIYISSRKKFLPYAPSAHSEADMRDYIRRLVSDGGVTIAKEGEIILGFIAVASNDDCGEIDQLYLHPNYVGLGIGTQLLNHAKAVLGGCIKLYTFQQNTAARRFYERNGFVAIMLTDGSTNEEKCPDVLYEWRRNGMVG